MPWRFLASGSDDGYIRIWDLLRATPVSSFHAHSKGISSITFSYNDQTIMSSSWDKKVKIWVVKPAISNLVTNFFEGLFGKKEATKEYASSLPSFILLQAKNNSVQASNGSNVNPDIYSFIQEKINIPVRNAQVSLEDWNKWLQKWKREEEKRRKEQRAKERLRLREKHLKLEKEKEERLRRKQKLQEEKLKQEQQQRQRENNKTDWWSSSFFK